MTHSMVLMALMMRGMVLVASTSLWLILEVIQCRRLISIHPDMSLAYRVATSSSLHLGFDELSMTVFYNYEVVRI